MSTASYSPLGTMAEEITSPECLPRTSREEATSVETQWDTMQEDTPTSSNTRTATICKVDGIMDLPLEAVGMVTMDSRATSGRLLTPTRTRTKVTTTKVRVREDIQEAMGTNVIFLISL